MVLKEMDKPVSYLRNREKEREGGREGGREKERERERDLHTAELMEREGSCEGGPERDISDPLSGGQFLPGEVGVNMVVLGEEGMAGQTLQKPADTVGCVMMCVV